MLRDLLEHERAEIITRCARRYALRHPERSVDELIEMIPDFLEELAVAARRQAAIGGDDPDPVGGEALRHGEQRYRRGYAISQVIFDYGVICDVISELALENHLALDVPSYKLLNLALDRAMAEAITVYTDLSRTSQERAVAERLGTLGHEARNALASATMAYQVLRSGSVGITGHTADVLERSLNRLGALFTQALAEVQLDSLAPAPVQSIALRELLEEIESATLLERGIRLHLEVSRTLELHAPRGLVESIFTNLIQNAVKYTRAGGRVEVRARGDGERVIVEVEDECGGLGDIDPRTLFDAFTQGKNGRRGIGMGLAITERAVSAIGGGIAVHDLPPKGCVFVLSLPRGT